MDKYKIFLNILKINLPNDIIHKIINEYFAYINCNICNKNIHINNEYSKKNHLIICKLCYWMQQKLEL